MSCCAWWRVNRLGTRFCPLEAVNESRKRYILSGGRGPGVLQVDEGAARALQARRQPAAGRPASRARAISSRRHRARVSIRSEREIARGIANYSAADLKRILGRRSDEIESILGYYAGDEVIHRNDLVLWLTPSIGQRGLLMNMLELGQQRPRCLTAFGTRHDRTKKQALIALAERLERDQETILSENVRDVSRGARRPAWRNRSSIG